MPAVSKCYRVAEVARRKGVDPKSVRQAIAAGKLSGATTADDYLLVVGDDKLAAWSPTPSDKPGRVAAAK